MKKKYVLIAITIIGTIGWCSTVSANESMIDLGTIQYSNTQEKVLVVTINSTELIDLRYISSDIDSESLYIDNCWFATLDNETTYIFATRQIEVEWWFINNTKCFIYQDNNTKQLYKIEVDYFYIDIPVNPIIEWIDKYNESSNSLDELQILFEATLDELNETRAILEEKWNTYNQSKEIFDNNSLLVVTLNDDLDALQTRYDDLEVLWISAFSNLSAYTTYNENLEESYGILQKEHNDLSGAYPLHVTLAVIITAIIIIFITWFKRRGKYEEESSGIKKEISTGYSQKASMIDKFTAGLGKLVKPKKKLDIEDIHKELDGIKLTYDAFQTSTVKNIQDIQKRVDVIETKVKITRTT